MTLHKSALDASSNKSILKSPTQKIACLDTWISRSSKYSVNRIIYESRWPAQIHEINSDHFKNHFLKWLTNFRLLNLEYMIWIFLQTVNTQN